MLSILALMVISAYVPPVSAQGTTPRLLTEINVASSANDKYPSIIATGATVHFTGGVSLTGGSTNTDAYYWNIAEQATSIGAGVSIGRAKGKPDYSPVSIGSGPDGTIYAIFTSIDDRTITLRRRDSAGAWGPARLITSGGFPVFPEVAATATQVFAMWQDVQQPLFLKVSSDQGATWSPAVATSEKTYTLQAKFSVSPSNQVAIGFTTLDLQAAVALWNGSALTTEILSAAKTGAGTTVSYGPDGKLYAAWRGLGSSGTGSGIYYAERQSANSWASTQLVQGAVRGSVNVVVDSASSVHLGWGATVTGGPRFFYAIRQAGQSAFSTAVSANSANIFNPRLAVSSNGAFVHAVYENFSGGPNFMTYARFSGGLPAVSAAPNIASTGNIMKRTPTVSVSFTNVNGTPNQVRWRWGAAPTDTTNDSNGWQTFNTTMNIDVPTSVLDAATCSPITLYTQVRNATSVGAAQSDDVTIDAGVTAAVSMTNPHLLRKSSQFTSVASDGRVGDLGSDGGASDGALNYTRDPLLYVGLQGLSECSGIQDLATARSTTTVAPALAVTKDAFANVLPIPGAFNQGNNSVMLRVSDKVGNIQDITQTFVYDTTPPVLDTSSAKLTATSNRFATLITALKFDTVNVTDNLYPGRGFWGFWVANSRTSVANPTADNSLSWFPVQAPGSGTSFTIDNWSLSSGLSSSSITPGDYYIYVRALDGAGNASTGVLSAKVTLTQVTRSAVYLPMTKR
jgi:hypothetical protein